MRDSTMRHFRLSALLILSGFACASLSAAALAGAAPEEAISVLQQRGYTAIEIVPGETPGYQANACKGGTRFSITLDPRSNIIDVDPRGACAGQPPSHASAESAPGPSSPAPPEPEVYGGYKGEGYHGPAVAYAPLLDELYRRGYYDIRVVDSDDDEIEVLACRNGRLYEIEMKRNGRIDDIDRKGSCAPRRHAGRDGVYVDAPFTGVHVGKGDVNVEAPFTGVHVGRDGVRVRAPFVDLHVPR